MARGKTRTVPHRRRREDKTDYRHRLRMLKSGKTRLVVRRSKNNITCQLIRYASTGDNVAVSADSRKLGDYGWKGHTGNIPAAYLTGLLCGINGLKAGVREAVFDTGLYPSVKGSRIYAALKGAVDAGLNVPHSEDVMPHEDRLQGKHTKGGAKEFQAAKEKITSSKPEAKPKTDKTKRPI